MADNEQGGQIPVDTAADPRIDACGDLEMRIAADGGWFYRGSPIGRLPLVKLFASVLRREADGSHWLITPAERCRVQVDDAPFLIVEAVAEGEGRGRRLRLRTNVERWIEVGDRHPLRIRPAPGGEPRIYVALDHGLEAALARPVWYQLVELALSDLALSDLASAEADRPKIAIFAGGVRFDLSDLAASDVQPARGDD